MLKPISITRFFILTISILLLNSLSDVHSQGLSPDDVASIETVGAVAMSPDGNSIAYTLSVPRTEDEDIGRNYSELYVVPADGGDPVPVIQKPNSAGSPQWGADGRLYFTTRNTDYHNQVQVYSVNRSGEDFQQHSSAEHGLSSFSWSDNGSFLAYTAMDPVSDERREMEQRGYDMIVAGENQRFMRLWIQPRDGDAEKISPDDLYIWDFSWAPNSRQLAIRVSDEPGADIEQMYTRYAVINRDGSDLNEIMTAPKKKAAMSWSPDGNRLAVLAGRVYSDPLPQRIWVMSSDGTEVDDLTPAGWEGTVESISWQSNRALLFTAVERSSTTLNRMRIDQPDMTRIAGGEDEIFRSISLDERNRTFAASVNTREHPGEVYRGTIQRGELSRITHHNEWLSDRELGEQSSITWPGADGLEMEGILVKPVGYEEGTRYPLAILPHGGPEGISMNGWNTRALYPSQVLANEGYVVFKPNYRGSGGRGTVFASANHRDLGGKEFDDVLLGIESLDDMGLIDPEKVGISGTSYGGYFAAWAATRHSDRFAAGITFAGLSNWISFMGTTDIPHEMSVVHWDLYWFDNPGQNWERSPVAWLNQADTPLLVVHGLADDRVHPEQSIQLHQFLEMKGIPTGLVLYPRQPHGLTERAHQLDFMNRVIEWFDEYVK
ncbi:S9 family peptidase [Rhodohalobacter sp. SW132]|uniref:S9 family peptidase n=1 Tax=Rhodohalobacter sp. SW132 TaxID=2293433 RepID=UPI000E22B9A9|nr:S9 family peptidase [Rhodohalobacter sp. SW132]REL38970.1 S9 family peptidase [Rhodohalobacter sp. SW132]